MEETPDKPAGTEEHPPDRDPARQGPPQGDEEASPVEEGGQRTNATPPDEGSPGRRGITAPRR
jgi:hypothetical protein